MEGAGFRHLGEVRLLNMMKMSGSFLISSNPLDACLPGSIEQRNRSQSIEWMKQVYTLSKGSSDLLYSGLQIFDRFLAISFLENKDSITDTSFLSYSAAVSMIISSKLHESMSKLSLASFQQLDKSSLKAFEMLVLKKIGFWVPPQVTPSSFIGHFVDLWKGSTEKVLLEDTANALVKEFFEAHDVLKYAPSTVAIAAILLSFSLLEMDCSKWLSAVPDFCLPHPNNPLFMDARINRCKFDIDSCLMEFQTVRSFRTSCQKSQSRLQSSDKSKSPSKSPTSIALGPLDDDDEDDFFAPQNSASLLSSTLSASSLSASTTTSASVPSAITAPTVSTAKAFAPSSLSSSLSSSSLSSFSSSSSSSFSSVPVTVAVAGSSSSSSLNPITGKKRRASDTAAINMKDLSLSTDEGEVAEASASASKRRFFPITTNTTNSNNNFMKDVSKDNAPAPVPALVPAPSSVPALGEVGNGVDVEVDEESSTSPAPSTSSSCMSDRTYLRVPTYVAPWSTDSILESFPATSI